MDVYTLKEAARVTKIGMRHFAEYLTGLFIAERKTVSGINREFAVTTDQSYLNRWLTEVNWDANALDRGGVQRLAPPGSRDNPRLRDAEPKRTAAR